RPARLHHSGARLGVHVDRLARLRAHARAGGDFQRPRHAKAGPDVEAAPAARPRGGDPDAVPLASAGPSTLSSPRLVRAAGGFATRQAGFDLLWSAPCEGDRNVKAAWYEKSGD